MQAKAKKLIPILFRQGKAHIVRENMDSLRRFVSKSFFASIQTIANSKKSSQRAIRFSALREGEILAD